jgi:autophagy-related protein 2
LEAGTFAYYDTDSDIKDGAIMASFLLPTSIQKRLLRYALSHLEVLDTDALDLEHLDISWGTKSTLEFRDVGLRLEVSGTLLTFLISP